MRLTYLVLERGEQLLQLLENDTPLLYVIQIEGKKTNFQLLFRECVHSLLPSGGQKAGRLPATLFKRQQSRIDKIALRIQFVDSVYRITL